MTNILLYFFTPCHTHKAAVFVEVAREEGILFFSIYGTYASCSVVPTKWPIMWERKNNLHENLSALEFFHVFLKTYLYFSKISESFLKILYHKGTLALVFHDFMSRLNLFFRTKSYKFWRKCKLLQRYLLQKYWKKFRWNDIRIHIIFTVPD